MEETKKKLSGGKIAAIVIASILGVILIAVGALAIVLFGAKQPESVKIDYQPLDVSMVDETDPTGETIKYYIGTENELVLNRAFPDATNFKGTGVTKDGEFYVIKRARDGELSFTTKDGNNVTLKVYAVKAYNLAGARAEKDMRDKYLKKGKSVVLHEDMITKDKAGFEIAKDAHVYGNGHELHADSISAPRGKTAWGSTLFSVGSDHQGIHVQDLHIFVNTIKPNAEGKMVVDLESFQYSGTAFDVNSYANSKAGGYAQSTLINCIVENGQKLVHVTGGNVLIDGCIIRNGADANIAAGTYKHAGSKITIRNSVSANSMVAGFLFYGWDPANDAANQTTLNVEGFFDIYNWKSTNAAKLVPATEAPLDTIVNGQVLKSVNDKMFAPYVHFYDANKDGKIQMPEAAAKNYEGNKKYDKYNIEVSNSVDERYIHIGIIRLATGSLTNQNPLIQYEGKDPGAVNEETGFAAAGVQPTYTEVNFPLPSWVKDQIKIVKRCDMVSYDNEQIPTILPDQQLCLEDNEKEGKVSIFTEMKFGRKPAETK